MSGINFANTHGYGPTSSVWNIPKDDCGNEKINMWVNLYAGKVLQPLINIRNNVMADTDISPLKKRCLSYAVALVMVGGGSPFFPHGPFMQPAGKCKGRMLLYQIESNSRNCCVFVA